MYQSKCVVAIKLACLACATFFITGCSVGLFINCYDAPKVKNKQVAITDNRYVMRYQTDEPFFDAYQHASCHYNRKISPGYREKSFSMVSDSCDEKGLCTYEILMEN